MFHPMQANDLRLLREADRLVAAEGRPNHQAPRIRNRWLRSIVANRRTRRATRLHPSFELCSGLGSRRLRQLENHLDFTELDAGTSLGAQGELVERFVLVLAGEVGVSIDGSPIAVLGAGNHFGERGLLNESSPTWKASFTALTPVLAAIAGPGAFAQMMADFPSVAAQVRDVAAMRRAYVAGRTDAKSEASYPIDHHYSLPLKPGDVAQTV